MMKRFTIPLIALLTACGGGLRQFPNQEPMWQDDDQRPFSPMPEEYYSPFAWDGANQMAFRPMSRFFAVDPAGRAANVNAFDEVPNSSWWTNRIGMRPMSVEEVVQAACDEDPIDPNEGPWMIVSAKPNGANPGFIVEDTRGRKYLLKFDGDIQPQRATAADVSGSIYYHAAGYNVPCNRMIFFNEDILEIEEGTTYDNDDGDEVPLTMEKIQEALVVAYTLPDGRIRGSSSLFIDGRPIGPWTYEGTNSDDPNDIIDHMDRRELRGGHVIAAWFNHFDAREQNTMAAWMTTDEESGAGYVRHYYIDFGDCYGSEWPWDGLSRRLGHSSYLDIPDVAADFLTFGLLQRPWQRNEWGPGGRIFGYFDVDTFAPEEWDPGYPNPAFVRRTEADSAWMARIIAQFRDPYIEAIADEAQLSRPVLRNELVRVLEGRRNKILLRYFQTLSPLTHPRLEPTDAGAKVCMSDLAVFAEVADRPGTIYRSRTWALDGEDLEPAAPAPISFGATPDSVCVEVPDVGGTQSDPHYLIIDLLAQRGELDERSAPVRLHLYQVGSTEYNVVGLERPEDRDPPG